MEAQGIKTYDKEKLHEYAKELFALCLEKGISMDLIRDRAVMIKIGVNYYYSYFSERNFNTNNGEDLPIWELIEKVKQL